MTLRESILAAKPAQKTVTLKALKAAGGKPLRVTVRALSASDDVEVARKSPKDDPYRRGLLTLTYAILDPKSGERLFTPEDVEALEKLKPAVINELFALYGEVRSEVEEQAKK